MTLKNLSGNDVWRIVGLVLLGVDLFLPHSGVDFMGARFESLIGSAGWLLVLGPVLAKIFQPRNGFRNGPGFVLCGALILMAFASCHSAAPQSPTIRAADVTIEAVREHIQNPDPARADIVLRQSLTTLETMRADLVTTREELRHAAEQIDALQPDAERWRGLRWTIIGAGLLVVLLVGGYIAIRVFR